MRGLLVVAALLMPGAALAAGCGSFIVTQPYHPPPTAASARQDKTREPTKASADEARTKADAPPHAR